MKEPQLQNEIRNRNKIRICTFIHKIIFGQIIYETQAALWYTFRNLMKIDDFLIWKSTHRRHAELPEGPAGGQGPGRRQPPRRQPSAVGLRPRRGRT